MAISGGDIQYGIKFNVDKSSVSSLENTLKSLNLKVKSINGTENFNKELKESAKIADSVRIALSNAFNADLGTVNLTKFNQQLKSAGVTVENMKASLERIGEGAAYNNIIRNLSAVEKKTKETSKVLDGMATTFKNTIGWGLSSAAFRATTGSIREAFDYAKKLDSSLNDIRLVTKKSTDQMRDFAKEASKAAQALGKTTTEYTNASLIYYQQGLSDKDVHNMADTTLKVSNTTGQDTSSVSEELTALKNGYNIATEDMEQNVDKLAAVASKSASSLSELSTAMSRVASTASTTGVNVDQLTAQISTIESVTRQDAASIGTALKTIYARMGDLAIDKSATDEFGVSLGDVSGKLQQVGVNVLDSNGELRDMGGVIEEVGQKWQSWTKAQKEAVAIAIAGKRQYNNLFALFENFDQYDAMLDVSANSLGELSKQNNIYMESTQAHLNQLKQSTKDIYGTLFDTKEINPFIDALNELTKTLGAFIGSLGGGFQSFSGLAALISQVFNQQIANGIINAKRRSDDYKASLYDIELEMERINQGVSENDSEKNIQKTQQRLDLLKQVYDLGENIPIKMHNALKQEAKDLADINDAYIEANAQASEYSEKFEAATQKAITANEGALRGRQLYVNDNTFDQHLNAIRTGTYDAESMSMYDILLSKQEQLVNLSQQYTQNEKDIVTIAGDWLRVQGELNESLSDLGIDEKNLEENYADQISQLEEQLNITKEQNVSDEERKNAALKLQKILQSIYQFDKLDTETLRERLGYASKEGAARLEASSIKEGSLNNARTSFDSNIKRGEDYQDTAKGITTLTSSVSSLTMAMSNGASIAKVWSDDTVSSGEKMLRILMSLSMTVGMLTSSWKSLDKAFQISKGFKTIRENGLGSSLGNVKDAKQAREDAKQKAEAAKQAREDAKQKAEAAEEARADAEEKAKEVSDAKKARTEANSSKMSLRKDLKNAEDDAEQKAKAAIKAENDAINRVYEKYPGLKGSLGKGGKPRKGSAAERMVLKDEAVIEARTAAEKANSEVTKLSAEVEEAETVSTEANTAVKEANTAATEADTAAKTLNTDATKAEKTAKDAETESENANKLAKEKGVLVSGVQAAAIMGVAAVVLIAVAALNTYFERQKEINEANIKFAKESIEKNNKVIEEKDNIIELSDNYLKLYDSYSKTKEGSEELYQAGQALKDALKEQGEEVLTLTSNYDAMAEAALNARDAAIEAERKTATDNIGQAKTIINSEAGKNFSGWERLGSAFSSILNIDGNIATRLLGVSGRLKDAIDTLPNLHSPLAGWQTWLEDGKSDAETQAKNLIRNGESAQTLSFGSSNLFKMFDEKSWETYGEVAKYINRESFKKGGHQIAAVSDASEGVGIGINFDDSSNKALIQSYESMRDGLNNAIAAGKVSNKEVQGISEFLSETEEAYNATKESQKKLEETLADDVMAQLDETNKIDRLNKEKTKVEASEELNTIYENMKKRAEEEGMELTDSEIWLKAAEAYQKLGDSEERAAKERVSLVTGQDMMLEATKELNDAYKEQAETLLDGDEKNKQFNENAKKNADNLALYLQDKKLLDSLNIKKAITDGYITEQEWLDFLNEDGGEQAAAEFGKKLFKHIKNQWDKANAEKLETATSSLIAKLQSGEITYKNIKSEDSPYGSILEQLESIKSLYPQLTEEARILEDTQMAGTKVYENALRNLREAMFVSSFNSDAGEAQKTATKIDNEIKVKVNSDDFDELIEDIEKFSDYKMNMILDVSSNADAVFGDVKTNIDKAEESASKIGENFTVSTEDIKQVGEAFPGILEDYEVLKDGTIKLNKDSVKSATELAKKEQENAIEVAKTKIDSNKKLLENQRDILKAEIERLDKAGDSEAKQKEAVFKAQKNLAEGLSKIETESTNAELKNNKTVAESSAENATAVATNWTNAWEQASKTSGLYANDAVHNQEVARTGQGTIQNSFTGETKQAISTDSGKEKEASEVDFSKTGMEWKDFLKSYKANLKEEYELVNDKINSMDASVAQLDAEKDNLKYGFNNAQKGKNTSGEKKKEVAENDINIYERLDRQLEKIQSKLSILQSQNESLLGVNAQRNLEKQIKLLEKEQKINAQKVKTTQLDASIRQKGLSSKYGVTFDSEGEIKNYDKVYMKYYKKWADATATYNKNSDATNRVRMQNAETKLKSFTEDYEKYQNALSTADEAKQQLQELENELTELRVKKWSVKVDLRIETNKAKTEYNNALTELMEDGFNDIFEKAKNESRNASLYMSNMVKAANKANQVSKAIKDIKNGKEDKVFGTDMAAAQEALNKYSDEAIESAKSIKKAYDDCKQAILEAIDSWGENIEKIISYNNELNESLETTLNMAALAYGENSEVYKNMSQAAYKQEEENSRNNMAIAQKSAAESKARRDERYEELRKKGKKDTDIYQDAQWQKYNDDYIKFNKTAQEEGQKTIQTIQKASELAVKNTWDVMEKEFFGKTLESIDLVWNMYERRGKQFLDGIERKYQTSILTNEFNSAIDEQTSVEMQNRLRETSAKILDDLKDKVNLDEKDLDIARKRLQVEQARIALEQAQQNKSNMRLRRDSQGNYSYQFTADLDEVEKAKKNLEEKQYDLYKAEKEHTSSVAKDFISDLKDLQERYANAVKMGDEEAKKAIIEQYSSILSGDANKFRETVDDLFEDFKPQILEENGLSEDMWESLSDEDKINLLKKSIPELSSGFDVLFSGIQNGSIDVEKIVGETTTKVENEVSSSQEKMQGVLDALGIALGEDGTLTSNLATVLKEATEESDKLIISIDKQIKKIQGFLDDNEEKYETALKTIKDGTKKWKKAQDNLNDSIQETLSKLDKLIEKAKAAAEAIAATNYTGKASDTGRKGEGGKNTTKKIPKESKNVVDSDTYNKMLAGKGIGNKSRGLSNGVDIKGMETPTPSVAITTADRARTSGTKMVVNKEPFNGWHEKTKNADVFYPGTQFKKLKSDKYGNIIGILPNDEKITGLVGGRWGFGANITTDNMDKFFKNYKKLSDGNYVGLKTGGYTGSWHDKGMDSDNGKLAILHQKELVLNATDTKNLLKTIMNLRSMKDNILEDSIGLLSNLKSAIMPAKSESSSNIAQEVNIEATFPGVKSAIEIEKALKSLSRQATQYANSYERMNKFS